MPQLSHACAQAAAGELHLVLGHRPLFGRLRPARLDLFVKLFQLLPADLAQPRARQGLVGKHKLGDALIGRQRFRPLLECRANRGVGVLL